MTIPTVYELSKTERKKCDVEEKNDPIFFAGHTITHSITEIEYFVET